MRKHPVVAQNVFDLPGGPVLQDHVVECRFERKIEDSIQARVNSVRDFSTYEECGHRGVRIEDFAYRPEARVGPVQVGVKIAPERAVDIRKCVDAKTIEGTHLYPPERVLAQVLRCDWIVSSHVGENTGEPAFNDVAPFEQWRVRVGLGRERWGG